MRILAMEVYWALVSGNMIPRTSRVSIMMATPQLCTKPWNTVSNQCSGWAMNHSQP